MKLLRILFLSLFSLIFIAQCVTPTVISPTFPEIVLGFHHKEHRIYRQINGIGLPVKFPLNHQADRRDSIHISPDLFSGWDKVPFGDSSITYFVLLPGDYRSWGTLSPDHSGSAKSFKKITTYRRDSTIHPVNLSENDRVIIEQLNINHASYWFIEGLYISGTRQSAQGKKGGTSNYIANFSHHIYLHEVVIENVVKGNALRIHNSSYNVLQNSVIRNCIPVPRQDNIGITVSATANSESRGNIIFNNEIYNCTDGIQLIYNSNPENQTRDKGYAPETAILNNEIYQTEDYYIKSENVLRSCGENGIDIKMACESEKELNESLQIAGNILHGFRKTDPSCGGSGSWGEALVIHQRAKNVYIENNIIFDAFRGIAIGGSGNHSEQIKNISCVNNLICDLSTSEQGGGFAIVSDIPFEFIMNTVSNTSFLLSLGIKSNNPPNELYWNIFNNIREPGHYFSNSEARKQDNYWVNLPEMPGNVELIENRDRRFYSATSLKDFVIPIRKFTQPENKILKEVLLPRESSSSGKISNSQKESIREKWWFPFFEYDNNL